MVGLANLLGALGPFLAGGPLSLLLNLFDNNWRLILLMIAALGLVLSLTIGCFVRNTPQRKKGDIIFLDPYKESLWKRMGSLIKNPQAWVTVFYAGVVYVCLPLLGAYWGTSFLQARGLNRDVAASISSMLWVGYAVGAPLTGKISDSIKKRKPLMLTCALLGAISSTFIVYYPATPPVLFGIFFFFIGFASSGVSVSVAFMSEHVESKLHATAIGFNNSMITFLPAIIPPVISFLIQQAAGTNTTHFTVANFQKGLFLMPLIYGIAFLICLFLMRETYCRSQLEIVRVLPRNDL